MSASTPAFEVARCVRYRYQYSECRRCTQACPHNAIAANELGIALDAGKCRNCALCTAACPTGALTPSNLPRIGLLAQAVEGIRFSFACAPSGSFGDAVVPCLGALDATMLAYLGKRCVEVTLAGADHCKRCEHGGTGAAALARHVEARDALETSCTGEVWETLTILEDEAAPASGGLTPRRARAVPSLDHPGRFRGRKALQAPLELLVIDTAIRPGPRHVPKMRELLQIVSRRADGAACRVPALPGLPMAEMRLAPGCTNCEACSHACPTGALRIRETESHWNFLFLVDRCVGCGVCIEVCQPGVLRPTEVVDATPGRTGVALAVLARQHEAAL